MNKYEAVFVLKQFNAWRRDKTGNVIAPTPQAIGKAIDYAIRKLSQEKSAKND
jgi:hypothetical protein